MYYAQIATRPVSYLHRRNGHAETSLKISRKKGWLRVPDTYLSGVTELVDHCNAVYRRDEAYWREHWQPPFGMVVRFDVDEKGTPFIISPDDLRPIVRFCAQPKIYDLVTEYLGQRPVLANLSLAYTRVNNEKKIGSQQFHRDMGRDQIHMVVPIWPIDEETGPFTLLPADESERVIKALNHTGGRVSDEKMFSLVSPDKVIKLTGEPGTAYFASPYRCFHYGARSYKKPRLMLIANYSSAFAPHSDTAVCRCSNRALLDDGMENTRLLLGL